VYFRAVDKIVADDKKYSEEAEKKKTEPIFPGDTTLKMEEELMSRVIIDPKPEQGKYTKTFKGSVIRALCYDIIPRLHQWPVVKIPLAPPTIKSEVSSQTSQE